MPGNNAIALAKNYISILDEVYKKASVTADLTSNPTMMRAGANANEIIYPQIEVGGLGDYDRNSGYTSAAVKLQWMTAKFNYDRGARLEVDAMDNNESMNLAFTQAGAELQRTRVAPEADASAFASVSSTTEIPLNPLIVAKVKASASGATLVLCSSAPAWARRDTMKTA